MKDSKDTKKMWLSVVAVLLVLLVGGTVWGVMTSGEPTRTAEEFQQMGKDLREKMKTEGKDMTEEQRREAWTNYRKEYEKLPFEERKKLHESFEKREMERLDKYYTASKEEQEDQINKAIDRWEETYSKMQARRAENGGQGGGGRGPGGNRPPGGEGPPQAGGPGGDGNGPGGRGPGDPAVRDKRRREMLDMSTPEARAKRADYRMVLKEAAKERGLPEPRFGRGPGGGGPPGGGPPGGGPRGGGNPQPATPPVTP